MCGIDFLEQKDKVLFVLCCGFEDLVEVFLQIKGCEDVVQIVYQLARSSIWEFPSDGPREKAAATGYDSCWSYF